MIHGLSPLHWYFREARDMTFFQLPTFLSVSRPTVTCLLSIYCSIRGYWNSVCKELSRWGEKFARKGKEAKDDSGPVRSCLWGNCPNGGTKDMASHLNSNTWSCVCCWLSSLLLLNWYSRARCAILKFYFLSRVWETVGSGSFKMGLLNSQDLSPQSR